MIAWMHSRLGHYAAIAAASSLLLFANLGGASLWDIDEGRNATAAYEMMESGDYVVPTFNADLRVDKPALLYWCQIAAYAIFGVNEFAARLPSALAALMAALVVYELGRVMFRASTGLLGGLVVLTTPMLCGAGRFANPDALLHLFSVLCLFLFWINRDRAGFFAFAGAGAAAGLAMLAKGPAGIALPGAAVLIWLAWERRLSLLWTHRARLGVLVAMAIALPWYVWVSFDTHGNFLRGFFLRHNVDRFLSPLENHRGSFLYYPAVTLVGLGIWSLFLGLATWYGFWSAKDRSSPRWAEHWQRSADPSHASTYRFLWIWIVVYLAFFTLAATKLPNYILPTATPWALLIARLLDRVRLGELSLPRWAMPACLAGLAVIGAGAALGIVIASGVWGRVSGRAVPGLEAWAFVGAAPMLAAALAYGCWRREKRTAAITSLVVGVVAFLGPLAAGASAVFNGVKSVRPLVEQAGALCLDEDIRIGAWEMNHLPSLNFYVRRDVIQAASGEEALTLLRYPLPVYLFVPACQWDTIAERAPSGSRVVARAYDMYRNGEVVVVRNQ